MDQGPEPVNLKRHRTIRNLLNGWVVVPALGALAYFSEPFLQWIARGGETVHAMPIETWQTMFFGWLIVGGNGLFAHLMASLTERMFRENSYGQWSRYGVVWLGYFVCSCFLAASML